MAIIKNIETKMKLIRFVAIISILSSIIISIGSSYFAYLQVINARKSVYILDNNIPIMAKQTDAQMNRPAEYRADIDLFHSIFFSLTPDDKHIEYQMQKAMYLVDESGVQQYNNLKEKGFFTSILASSSVLSIETDSIYLDMPKKYFRYFGKQKIDRRSSTLIRSLVTEGTLKDIPRSVNNPHGVLIVNWKTLENKDIENVQKNSI